MITGPVSKKLKSPRPRPGSIEKKLPGSEPTEKKIPGPGPKEKNHRDRDRDRDQRKKITGTGTGTKD